MAQSATISDPTAPQLRESRETAVSESRIHTTTIIDPTAEIASDVVIGPFCIIGPNVRIASGTTLSSHIRIECNTHIGRDCQIFHGVALGGPPQDTKFKGEPSLVVIGDNNVLREYVTIHRATGENCRTRLGDNNLLMAYAHIGHNCEVGNNVTLASYVGVSGHVTIEDFANLGGITGIHQYCRIGKMAMIGGLSGVVQDVPPFMLANGRPARVYDVNVRGLRRAGVPAKVRGELREAYKLLYRSNLNNSQALEAIEEEIETSPELEHLLAFIRSTREGYGGRGNNPNPT
jgi:UDP-N-acetylglucosamine acyltransferase